MTMNFVQSTFDKAFVRAVEFLLKERLTTSQRFLADEFKITPSVLSLILKGLRNVPKEKREYITYVLTHTYNVSKSFLDKNKGAILMDPLPIDGNEYPQFEEVEKSLKECIKENEVLKIQLRTNEELIATQKLLIQQLQSKN